jgi:phage recombination protein Bet
MPADTKAKPEDVEQTLDPNEDDQAAEEAVAESRELARYDSRVPRLHTGEPAYKQFSKEMLSLVAKTIMPPKYSTAELYMGLEIAATYGLDPFTRELWLVRMKENGPVVPLVGRDGMLAIAERHSDYRGFRDGVVYEHDEFSVEDVPFELPSGQASYIRHKIKGFGDRGELLGAWAEVYREGKEPSYFLAYVDQYRRQGNTPWAKQPDVMIVKVALVNALRKAFRISGLYVGDEVTGASLEMGAARERTASGEPKPLHEDSRWAERFETLFRLRNEITPGTYLPAKQTLLVSGCEDEAALEELAGKLEDEIREAGGVVPEPAAEDDEEPLEGEHEEPDEAEPTAAEVADEPLTDAEGNPIDF